MSVLCNVRIRIRLQLIYIYIVYILDAEQGIQMHSLYTRIFEILPFLNTSKVYNVLYYYTRRIRYVNHNKIRIVVRNLYYPKGGKLIERDS